jgi:hypothetical protein
MTSAADLRAAAARIERDAPGFAARMRREADQMDAAGGERTTQDVARNIVNQLADLWEVDPMTRQATNDEADAFVARLIADYYLEKL